VPKGVERAGAIMGGPSLVIESKTERVLKPAELECTEGSCGLHETIPNIVILTLLALPMSTCHCCKGSLVVVLRLGNLAAIRAWTVGRPNYSCRRQRFSRGQ
jgi:hypothetical protein